MARASPPFAATDAAYEHWAAAEVARWRDEVLKPANLLDRAAKGVQGRINRLIPEKVHAAVTSVMEGLTRTILTGADLTTAAPIAGASLRERDRRALEAIEGYRTTAAVEGGVAGAGGFWLALADFPALLVIKIKLLFDLAAIYGHEADRFEERLYILALFQLAFSSADHRAEVFAGLEGWDGRDHPADFEHFDWRRFQQEYRDYIDLAKLAQMIPVVGAPIGAFVNYRLLERLGDTAMNGYRMRWLARS
ncbi:EcsC family protein [Phenylobacterium sp.]|uniref:EcsC family protein n=1 Tax=Phenylobacterium sp. TaxID=1871053 RepID=UPI0025F6E6B1|nr:EcsC family protein [Phenylobacterium sp.]